jgi:methylated-DNA-[protein]-cysteine S-methyltransferase
VPKEPELLNKIEDACLETPLGTAILKGGPNGLKSVTVTNRNMAQQSIPDSLKEACTQLQEYFEGNRKEFHLKLDPEGTPFQQKVWAALLQIPFGKTLSYMELSKQLGDPKAIRAVAGANAKNPLWIVIPCHRVVGSDGDLTGYAGGIYRKKWLLNHESASPQQSLF